MGKYSIEHGYREDKGWPRILLLLVLTFSIITPIYWYTQLNNLSDNFGIIKYEAAKTESVSSQAQEPAVNLPLPWPQYGQSAYGVSDDGVIATSNVKDESVPIASLAKVITALAVLDKNPLSEGAQGEILTMTNADVAIYQEYVAKSGTVVPITEGEEITQYQALQAMLLASGNNISDTLAIWAFGSLEKYNEYANNMLKDIGIQNTVIADASGLSPETKSTASDMVKIGIAYMGEQTLRDIAAQTNVTLPYAGQITNFNSVINNGGIVGLKVGNTDEAGRTFLVADVREDGKVSVVSVLGADNLQAAMKDAKTILMSGNAKYDSLENLDISL